MATRLYFIPSAAPRWEPAFDAAWQSSAEARRRMLSLVKIAGTETWQGNLGGAINDNDCIVMGISPPLLGDQTISGTHSLESRGRELATTDNVNNRGRTIRVWRPSTASYVATLTANAYSASTTELSTTLAGQQHSTGGSLTSFNALHGDVVVFELGYRETVTGTTPQWETQIGGNGTDHANTNNDTTGTVPWVELSANLVFQPWRPVMPRLTQAMQRASRW